MALIPDSNDKSLWSPATRLVAGVHAIVIGISDYPYLKDGSAPQRAPNNGGLGQLPICALTAARIFDWLNKNGEAAGAPIATCRLLLAPSATDKAEVDRLTQGHYGAPDFVSIRTAVEAWRDDIYAGGNLTEANVALLFFSGHGVEIQASPAVLAMDALKPGPAGAHKGIAVESLSRAVKTYGIDRGLFFIDACRDSPTLAMTLNMTGEDLVKPYPYPPKSPDALISLQSTRSGAKAYLVPTDPATIFGQALLEALEGPPPSHVPYDTTTNPWRLVFKNLEAHVKKRVPELLKNHGALRIQQVDPYGYPYNADMLVAEKRGPLVGADPLGGIPPEPPPPSSGPKLTDLIAARSIDLLKGFTTFTAIDFDDSRTPGPPDPGYSDLTDFGIMHRILQHEWITEPWIKSLQILDAETGKPVQPNTVNLMEGRSQQVGDSLTAWLDLSVAPGAGQAIWISTRGDKLDPSYAVVIARDLKACVPVRLDVSFRLDKGAQRGAVESMSARLAAPQEGTIESHIWWSLWEIQRLEALFDLGRAGMAAYDLDALKLAVKKKVESPLAAAIATTVLLRCGSLEYLHDWPRNLADWFEWLPDGPVLWAETLLRRFDEEQARKISGAPRVARPAKREASQDDRELVYKLAQEPSYKEARKYFSRLARSGPPLLSPSLAMAVRQLPFWRRLLEIGAVSGSEARALKAACEVVEHASRYAASGGLFAAFVSAEGSLTPDKVLVATRQLMPG